MGKYNKIYVFAPYKHTTGGVELAHQLVDYLRNKGECAYITYIDKSVAIAQDTNVTETYQKYNIAINTEIEDEKNNILVLPEMYFEWILKYKYIQLGCWWMSVDNRYNACTLRDAFIFSKGIIGKIRVLKHFCFNHSSLQKNNNALLRKEQNRIIHYYQSHYAQYHLYSLGLSRIMSLSDYINRDMISARQIQKENIILYNPSKGYWFTKKIISRMPEYKFIPLKGLSRVQLNDLFDRAKLYIDFGNFPGKDRLSREAVCHNCCVLTGMDGAAFFYEDVPIAEEYKFCIKLHSLPYIAEEIAYILDNYEDCIKDFQFYKKAVMQEENKFYSEIDTLFL